MNPCEIYLLTPQTLDLSSFKPLLIEVMESAPISAIQLRVSDLSKDQIRQELDALQPIVQDRGIAFILEKHSEIAKEYMCDGVHIDGNKQSVELTRSLIGNDLQLGVTCYDSRDMAMKAGEKGADYVSFGPNLSTNIRIESQESLVRWWSEVMELPVVAYGGITTESCEPLIKAGADFLAISSSVWSHPEGPLKAIEYFSETIKKMNVEK